MAASSVWVKKTVAVLCLGGSALAIYNVYTDIAPLQKRAEATACGDSGCQQLIGLHRTPISQSFTFQVEPGSSRTVSIECQRSAWLFGEYSCEREGAAP